MKGIIDATFELNKLIKYYSKRKWAFNRLKKETPPGNFGYKILCPTGWTVRGVSFRRIWDKWTNFKLLKFYEILEERVKSEVLDGS